MIGPLIYPAGEQISTCQDLDGPGRRRFASLSSRFSMLLFISSLGSLDRKTFYEPLQILVAQPIPAPTQLNQLGERAVCPKRPCAS